MGLNTFYAQVQNGTYYSGGGGLSSTASDYMKFLQMLANGGIYNGHQLLSPSTIRLMTTDQIDNSKAWGSENEKFGLNVRIVTEIGSAQLPWNQGAFNWAGVWGTYFWVDPKAGVVAEIMTQDNGTHFGEMTNKFISMVYSALVK